MTTGGFSAARLRRMHDVMSGHVKRDRVPGLVTAVSRGGEVQVDAIGTMTVDGGTPVRRDTVFRISSMTKPITAAATMLLVEDGKVRLDERVDQVLPELADRRVLSRLDGPLEDTVPARRPITVRDLLTFTLGFGQLLAPPDRYPILQAAIERAIGMGPPTPSTMPPPDEWIRRLGSLPLMRQPGEEWIYNTGADVLGVLIARVSGQPFDRFLTDRLFGPMGMKDTGFSVPAAGIDRLGPTYWTDYRTGQEGVYDEGRGGQWSRPPAFPSGAGGLVSTADDYLAFARMMVNEGEHGRTRILSKRSVEAMTTNQLTAEQRPTLPLVPGYFDSHGWGFCMSVLTKPDDLSSSPGRYGWDGGMGTSWFNDPSEGLVSILMTDRMWSSPTPPDVCREFWALAYEAIRD